MSETEPRKLTERDLRIAKPFMKILSHANTWVFRVSGGRLGNRFLRGAPVGLLTTRGRRSGRPRTAPLIYGADGDRILLVASQGGMPRDPLWYSNLVANPEVEFQTGREPRKMRARRATPEEKSRYWPLMVRIYRDYDDYQKRTERDIPVVVLEPR